MLGFKTLLKPFSPLIIRLCAGLMMAFLCSTAAFSDTPLHRAALEGNLDAITTLLNAGANPNARNKDGITSLHWAAIGGSPDAITTLLDAGANLKARNEDGLTSLHGAALQGHADAITTLLDAGADPNARAEGDLTPLDLIAEDSPAYQSSAWQRLHDAKFK